MFFETKPCMQRHMFVFSSGLDNFLGTHENYVCGYSIKDGRDFRQINPSQTLMNLQYVGYTQVHLNSQVPSPR